MHKILSSVHYNCWLKRLDTQLNESANQNSLKIPKVINPTNDYLYQKGYLQHLKFFRLKRKLQKTNFLDLIIFIMQIKYFIFFFTLKVANIFVIVDKIMASWVNLNFFILKRLSILI